MTDKMLVWGAMPMEMDGGAIVTYYQFLQMNYVNPLFQIDVIPKIWEQATPTLLPLVKFHKVGTSYFGQIPNEIPRIMKRENIKLLVLWHIPWEYFPIIDKVHKMGGKVLNWQTVHWPNDMLFLSDRIRDFDRWVPATKYAEDTLASVGGVDRAKCDMIPHGVNTSLFYPHESMMSFGPKLKTILFVGRCQLTKGIVPLMLCARKLVDRFNCRIIFKAGMYDGVYKAKEIGFILKKMSKWDNRIVFLSNWTPPNYMEELVNYSDVVVCPSGHEGSSLPPLEAMSCRKPVAITDIPVHRELLGGKNGVCGLLMPPSDHAEWVNDMQSVKVPNRDMIYGTLKYLLENSDEAEAMAENGLKRARETYDLNKICRRWFDVLGKI
jgi:glycosyltransferase involved in cell wall biosynthesis